MSKTAAPDVRRVLAALPAERQRRLAVLIADAVLPLGELAALTDPPLKVIAERLKRETDLVRIDHERRHLWDAPALGEEEEPSDARSWYAMGAVVAWLYAADSLSTAPADGAWNTYTRVADVLDRAESDLKVDDLVSRLDAAVLAGAGGDEQPLHDLSEEVETLSGRLAVPRPGWP